MWAVSTILPTYRATHSLTLVQIMNYSGSRSCSNLKDLRAIQPSYHEYDYPPYDGYPPPTVTRIMSPEQAIAENYYDVPRPVAKNRRSYSSGNIWKIQLHESLDGGSSSPTGFMDDVIRQSVSAPASPVVRAGHRAVEEFGMMSVRDQSIYHSMGSSSSKVGKVCLLYT